MGVAKLKGNEMTIAHALKTAWGWMRKIMGWFAGYKDRKHQEAVNAGVLAIRRHVESFPEAGAIGRKTLPKSEWVRLMPQLPNQNVADEVLGELGARVISTQEGKVWLLIDLNQSPLSRR